jgi:hypothetical protein
LVRKKANKTAVRWVKGEGNHSLIGIWGSERKTGIYEVGVAPQSADISPY